MTATERADLENAVRELEKSGQYASQRIEQISVAQKDLIQSMISSYVEDIKTEISDGKTIKCFLDITSSFLTAMSEKSSNEKRAFLPSIFCGQIWIGMGRRIIFFDF